jgi:hypothetical protein
MAVTVKKAVLWRKEVDNRPGMLASMQSFRANRFAAILRRGSGCSRCAPRYE